MDFYYTEMGIGIIVIIPKSDSFYPKVLSCRLIFLVMRGKSNYVILEAYKNIEFITNIILWL